MRRMQVVAVAAVLSWGARARAQSAATCVFDAGTATVTVTVDGVKASLLAVKASGQIRLDGVPCGGATVSNIDTIQVNGGGLDDRVSLAGSFVPGLTAEATGSSEIEIAFALGAGTDQVTVNLGNGNNRLTFTSGGIDVGNDLDEDITTTGIESVRVDGGGGNDVIDASAYTGTPYRGNLILYGGSGNDRLTGDGAANQLYGEDGDDTLYGGASSDRFYGGAGNDVMYGGLGPDRFYADAAADGSDEIHGGDDYDVVYYWARTAPVTVTIGNGLADDGEAGEADSVAVDIEAVYGGSGDDVLVGNNRANSLDGRAGNDEIYGGAGDDGLNGGAGNDSLFGEVGDDILYGDVGDDVLDGGPNADRFSGAEGNDIIVNDDGVAETVDCGDGIDDAEPDPLDTLVGCEL